MSVLDDARALLALADEAPYPVPLTAAAAALAALVAECERLREAIPPPAKLYLLAEWLDLIDAERGSTDDEVQRELRSWARAALAVDLA